MLGHNACGQISRHSATVLLVGRCKAFLYVGRNHVGELSEWLSAATEGAAPSTEVAEDSSENGWLNQS